MKPKILYVFGGEKAQGAEIVIERLMNDNVMNVDTHLFIAPGKFAADLIADKKPYQITLVDNLKKLNRSENNRVGYLWKALTNYISISCQVHQYIKANDIDVVHSNTIVPASYLIPLIIYSKVFSSSKRWFWSDHDITYYSQLEIYLSRFCAALYDNTLVVSNAVKKKYTGNNKVKVLYNGLDYHVFKRDEVARKRFRSKLKIENELMVFGMPAVVHPRKGQLELIAAFDELCGKYANIFLLLAGGFEDATPAYSEKVKLAARANGHINHLGYIDDMLGFYNGCDVIVNNSNLSGSEPLGTTIYEAMACERIVIASATGGTPEIISNNVDGFLFEPENRRALMDTMELVIKHGPGLRDLGKAARNKVKVKFGIEGMAAQYNQMVFKKQTSSHK